MTRENPGGVSPARVSERKTMYSGYRLSRKKKMPGGRMKTLKLKKKSLGSGWNHPVTSGSKKKPLPAKKKPKKVVRTSKKVDVADEKKYLQHKKIYKQVEKGLVEKFFPAPPVVLDEDGDPVDNWDDDDDYDRPKKTASDLPNFIQVKLKAVWEQLENTGEFNRDSMIEMNRLHQISQ